MMGGRIALMTRKRRMVSACVWIVNAVVWVVMEVA
jgi:hypothetical protein